MDIADAFVDAHTHKIKVGSNIAIVNIMLRGDSDLTKDAFPALLLPTTPNTGIYFSAGIHPWYLNNWESTIKLLEELACNPKVIAIGECGLDKNSASLFDKQEQALRFQISLSENLKKPLIIHCIKAFNELIRLRKATHPAMPWIIHGFNNSAEIAGKCLEAGMVLSFGKSLHDKNSKSVELVKSLANNEFLLETDESDFSIEEVYAKCSDVKGIATEKLKFDMFQNFNHYFASR